MLRACQKHDDRAIRLRRVADVRYRRAHSARRIEPAAHLPRERELILIQRSARIDHRESETRHHFRVIGSVRDERPFRETFHLPVARDRRVDGAVVRRQRDRRNGSHRGRQISRARARRRRVRSDRRRHGTQAAGEFRQRRREAARVVEQNGEQRRGMRAIRRDGEPADGNAAEARAKRAHRHGAVRAAHDAADGERRPEIRAQAVQSRAKRGLGRTLGAERAREDTAARVDRAEAGGCRVRG